MKVMQKRDIILQKNYLGCEMVKKDDSKKVFSVTFLVGEKIQTQIKMQRISPQEALGLLDMAKDQILSGLRKGTQNMFEMKK